ncbi:MAG: hypothetical protein P1U80_06425 [Pseudomonadales bacterium]|nr:hypothetical protein [Pseudomonadales bacterium]
MPTIVRLMRGVGFYLRHHWPVAVSLVSAVVAVFVLTYRSGLATGTAYSDRANAETQRLRVAIQDSEQIIEQQSIDIGQLRAQVELKKKTEQLTRAEMIQLTNQLVELQRENRIFRKVMDPQSFEKGLSIRSWDIKPSVLLHHFKFELVIQQLASRHPLLNGSVVVEISGVEDGLPRTISLDKLSDEIDKQKIKLRFRYFQEIRGEMVLPENFIPETVSVTARSRGKRPQLREKSFEWNPVEL